MTHIFWILFAFWCIPTAKPNALEVRSDKMVLSVLPNGDIRAQVVHNPNLLRAARLHVFDGKRKQTLTLATKHVQQEGKSIYIEYQPTSEKLSLKLTLQPHGRCLSWEVQCQNNSSKQQWLELGPELLLRPPSKLMFFDGYSDDIQSPKQQRVNDNLQLIFPVTIVWTPQAAIGVGIAASELVSYLRHEYRPGRDASLGSYTRIVIDAGKMEKVSFITCATRGEWGKYEVFDAYYESFPSYFVALPGIDPRATIGSTEYRAYPVGKWSPEICRRLWGGWEWCYAPFRRTGDIVGRLELWNYKPPRPFRGWRGLDYEKFHRWRKKAFSDGEKKCNVAMMFYIPAQVWCEVQLAQHRYADALTTDPKVRTYFDTPWVTGHDNDIRVFPYGTSFGEQSRRDIQEVAETLELSGFAFDTAGGTARYRGPALNKLAHRGWDDGGVFCNENVAVALLMDYVHTLRKRGRPLAVVANIGAGVYTSCFHCDTAMLEGEPWKSHRTFADRLRWKMGHKTCVWWESYGIENFVDPERLTAQQLKAIYRGLSDFALLQSLRVGFIPPPNFTQGIRKLTRWLPVITDCVQKGWEPVPAARVPAPLWTSRYGRGLDTCIVVAHETAEPQSVELAIENERIGQSVYLFAPYRGGTLQNKIAKDETLIELQVPVRTPLILRTVCTVSPTNAVQSAEVSLSQTTTRVNLHFKLAGKGGKAKLTVALPKDMAIHSATLDGQPIQPRRKGSRLTFESVISEDTELAVAFRSTIFVCAERDLLDFPFVKDGRPNCAIVLPSTADEDASIAAFRIQEYFRYWYGRANHPPADVRIPIQRSTAKITGPAVILHVEADAAQRVALQGQRLIITASNSASLKSLTFKLLRLLDTQYNYPDQLPSTQINRKLGIGGTVLEETIYNSQRP